MLTQQTFTRIIDCGEHRIREEITTINEVWGVSSGRAYQTAGRQHEVIITALNAN